jgi:hypothetical protein
VLKGFADPDPGPNHGPISSLLQPTTILNLGRESSYKSLSEFRSRKYSNISQWEINFQILEERQRKIGVGRIRVGGKLVCLALSNN